MTIEEILKSKDRYIHPDFSNLADQEIFDKVKHLLDVKFEVAEVRSSSNAGISAYNCGDCHTACCGVGACGDGPPGATDCGG